MTVWRLLVDEEPVSGAANMATDQAIMEGVGKREVPLTLRFYAWVPPCLSLGVSQSSDEVDFARLSQRGWEVVRRATGGKAILHTDELTYSIALPQESPLVAGGIVESYRRLSRALMAGLEVLGAAVESRAGTAPGRTEGPVCFEVPSHYEITAHGRKLIGSAQVRRDQAVLQHGSIPLIGDIARICDALVFPDDAARDFARERVRQRATTVEAALGQAITWSQMASSLHRAFAETFDVVIEHGSLTPTEVARRDELATEIYAGMAWTRRR